MRGLVFDTETTGPDPTTDRVVQLGGVYMTVDGCPVGQKLMTLVDPEVEIPKEASAVHGIYDADVWRKPKIAEVIDRLRSRLSEADFIVTYNGNRFDLPIMEVEAARVGAGPIFGDIPHVDVWTFVEWHHRALRPRTLVAMAQKYGVELRNAHDATADCVATGQLLLAMSREPWMPADPIGAATYSRRLLASLVAEREEFGMALYRSRDGDPEQLFLGMGIVNGAPLHEAHRFTLVQRAAVRRAIEAKDTPERVRDILEAHATQRDQWEQWGPLLYRDERAVLRLALGMHAGKALPDVPKSYLRMLLDSFDALDVTGDARDAIEPLASSAEDYARFGMWLYNGAGGRLYIGAGQHAGKALDDVPGGYLSGMARWGKTLDTPIPEPALKLVGVELGRRRRANARSRS